MPDWSHSPLHRLSEAGAYMVTAACYQQIPLFQGRKKLDYLQELLFSLAQECHWQLQAWALLPNHYHFIAISESDPESLRTLISQLHSLSARWLNAEDNTPGRQDLFQYWDTHLTYARSYYARLHYVHYNPVKHGLVKNAENYRWCSAAWFARTATPAFYKTVMSFPIDRLRMVDFDCRRKEL